MVVVGTSFRKGLPLRRRAVAKGIILLALVSSLVNMPLATPTAASTASGPKQGRPTKRQEVHGKTTVLAANHATATARKAADGGRTLSTSTSSSATSSACTKIANSCQLDSDCKVGVCVKGVCQEVEYAAVGQVCSDTTRARCAPGLKCHNATCVRRGVGDNCDSDSDCYASHCIDKRCDIYRATDDRCKKNSHCSSGSCVNSLCAGKEVGATCDPNTSNVPNQCISGSYCSDKKKCTASKSISAECDVPSSLKHKLDVCVGGSICDTTDSTGFCKTILSSREGDSCKERGLVTCKMSLACKQSKCESYTNQTAQCSADSDCPGGAMCTCSGCKDLASPACDPEIGEKQCPTSQTVLSPTPLRPLILSDAPLVVNTCASECKAEYQQVACCMASGQLGTYFAPPELACPAAVTTHQAPPNSPSDTSMASSLVPSRLASTFAFVSAIAYALAQ